MYKFWYDYIKAKYGDKTKLCYMDTDSFIMHISTEDLYKDTANKVNDWFDTWGYDEKDKRTLSIGINKKVIGMFKDELNGKVMSKFIALRAKTYAFLIDGYNDEDYAKHKIINKKAKGTKKCVIKKQINIDEYKDSLLNDKIILKSQQRF